MAGAACWPCSFGPYGLLKKTAGVGAVEGLAVETAVLAPVAAVYLLVVGVQGGRLRSAAPATLRCWPRPASSPPCRCCSSAVPRSACRMITLGLLQYLAPTLQFADRRAAVPRGPAGSARLLGFCLVWLALVVFTTDLVRAARARRPVPEPV